MIYLRSEKEISKIEKACKIIAELQIDIKKILKPGVTTNFINEQVEALARQKKAKLAFKNYRGFPKSICVSVNDEVVHGIPSSRILKKGDIVSIDIGIVKDGYYGDAAFTVGIEDISLDGQKIIESTEKALYLGIEQARIGNRLSDISHAVQSYVESCGFSVVRDLVGHGIGKNLHEDPQIPNFGPPNQGPWLKKGMVFAIEPMVTRGSWEVEILENGWTVVTRDHSISAHSEHTIAITEKKARILTAF